MLNMPLAGSNTWEFVPSMTSTRPSSKVTVVG